MKSGIQDLIAAYSSFRGLVEPDAFEALLFFFSEVGELAEAYLASNTELSENQRTILTEIHNIGLRADDEVSRMNPAWVRNYDRRKAPDIGSEIGDCRMMLEKFSKQYGDGSDSELHLRNKMGKKGFRDVKISEVSHDLQGKLTTLVWNKVKDGQITVRDVLKDWHNTGLVQELHLGKVGAKELIEALKQAGYYYSEVDLDDNIPIVKKEG